MPPLECAAPNCPNEIPEARRKRYPRTKTCSKPCSKAYRKAYVANWMGFYLLKKADLEAGLRWRNVQGMEAAGDELGAMIARGKVEQDAERNDQNRRQASDGNIKTYREMHPKRPAR